MVNRSSPWFKAWEHDQEVDRIVKGLTEMPYLLPQTERLAEGDPVFRDAVNKYKEFVVRMGRKL